MKKLLFFFAGFFISQLSWAQQPFFFKDAFSTAIADTIFYPVHGTFRIDETSFGSYKNLQLWVYDSHNKEVYYTIQSISTKEEYTYLVERMIDKTYVKFMVNNGHVLTGKCEDMLTGIIEY